MRPFSSFILSSRNVVITGPSGDGSGFAAAVMADSPWAWWKLADTSGSSVDSSGNARHLTGGHPSPDATYRGKPPLITDSGLATDYASTTSGPDWGTPGAHGGNVAMGLFAIIKPTNLAFQSTHWIAHNGNTTIGSQQGSLLGIDSAGRLLFWTNAPTGGWLQHTSSIVAMTDNETAIVGWYHDPTLDTITYYKNGKALQTVSWTYGLSAANADWTLGGANRGAGGVFVGRIQHVLVFDALADGRILAHAQASGLGDMALAPAAALLHFDGANGGTVFTDETGATWTRVGTCTTSTSGAAMGSSGCYQGAASSYINRACPEVAVGLGDFCVRGFCSHTSDPANNGIFGTRLNSTSAGIGLARATGGWSVYCGAIVINIPATFSTAGPVYFELTRKSGVVRLFIAGVKIYEATSTDNITDANLYIGAYYSNAYCWPGKIDEFEFLPRGGHVANYTPPTVPSTYP